MRIRVFAKYVYETTTGRLIPRGLTVDHIDGDKTNDSFSNLQLLSSAANSSKHAGMFKTRRMVELSCPVCGSMFIRPRRATHLAGHKNATTCSRSCAGKLPTTGTLRAIYVREFISAADSSAYTRDAGGSTPPTPTTVSAAKYAPDDSYFEKVAIIAPTCVDCGKEVSRGSSRCRVCQGVVSAKADYPSIEIMQQWLRQESIASIARRLGITAPPLRRWLALRGLI